MTHDSCRKVQKTRAALNSQNQRKKDHRPKQGKAKLPKVSFNNSFKVTLPKPRGGGQGDLAFKSILVYAPGTSLSEATDKLEG